MRTYVGTINGAQRETVEGSDLSLARAAQFYADALNLPDGSTFDVEDDNGTVFPFVVSEGAAKRNN